MASHALLASPLTVAFPTSRLATSSSLRAPLLNAGVIGARSTVSSRPRRTLRTSLKVHASQATDATGDVAVKPEGPDPALLALAAKFGSPTIKIGEGQGKLPLVTISNSGSTAELYLYGACVTSWKPAGGEDLLYVRPDAVFTGAKPISGGIPHCFPQFGPGKMQQHGFARNLTWEVASTGASSITLRLLPSDYTRQMWDHDFEALYTVKLGALSLETEIEFKNTGKTPYSFTTALHTYFRASIGAVTVKGLKGCKSFNKDPDPNNPIEGVEERDNVSFPGFVDCMYTSAASPLLLNNGLGDVIEIGNSGWKDAVLWNPHLTMAACYKEFVCVENAQLEAVTVQPGKSWTATTKFVPK